MSNDYPHSYTMTVSFRLDEHENLELTTLVTKLDDPSEEVAIKADQDYETFLVEVVDGTRGMITNLDLQDVTRVTQPR